MHFISSTANPMGDFNLKLSDIFRYILLGCIESILCIIIYNEPTGSINLETFTNTFKNIPPDQSILVLIVMISAFYFLGYITQLIISLFFHGNFLGTGIGETACFIKSYPKWIFNKEKFPFPDWIYYSEAPDKVVEIFHDVTETGSESESKLEFSYANQLFQGIALALISFTIFSLKLDMPEKITLLLITLLIFAALGATINKRLIIINKILMYIVPLGSLLILLQVKDNISDSFPLAALVSLGMLGSLFLAGFLARKQLRRIDILAHQADEKIFDATLLKYGVPRVFILTRVDDTALPHLREQMESIASQDYPDIKLILIVDKDNMDPKNKTKTEMLVDEFIRKGMEIQFSSSKGSGAATLAYEVRQVFINYATDNDISICLDADDKFAHPQVVSNIVAKMYRTQSNICIISFETFGNTSLNFAKNYHNDLVKMLAKKESLTDAVYEHNYNDYQLERKEFLTPKQLADANIAHLVSTLGWVKCYRKPIAKAYQQLLEDFKKDFEKYPKYEDFPDIVALLSDKSRICAVGKTSIMFRKRAGSVTTNVSKENYDSLIPYFMWLADALAAKVENAGNFKETPAARRLIHNLFVPYKFVQYLNVVYSKTVLTNELPDYSCAQFYHRFRKKIYSDDEAVFQQGIIEILNRNQVTKIFDDVPTGLAMRIKDKPLQSDEFPVVAEAYGIIPGQ